MFIRASLFLSTMLLGLMTASAQPTIKIGTEGTYRPWTMADAQGKVTGLDADLASALCQELGESCEFIVQNFDGLIPSLLTGRFDMVITSMSSTQDRAKIIDFSYPYATIPNVFAARDNSPLLAYENFGELKEGLANKRVGVLSGATQAQYISLKMPKTIAVPYDTMDQMLLDLAANRLDAGLADTTVWDEFFKKPQARRLVMLKPIVNPEEAPEILGYGIAIGLRKGNKDFNQKVNAALCKLITNGTVREISQKWLVRDLATTECKDSTVPLS